MSIPLVTIIMATYNRAHLIAETLYSIQSQTYINFQCLIIDDGGTDNTEKVVKPFLADNRFQYLKRPEQYKKGVPGCRNYGLDQADGEYVIFFDDDDVVHPTNLQICSNILENDSLSFCRYLRTTFTDTFDYKFDYDRSFSSFEIIGKRDVGDMITHKLPFNSCAVMWRKKCFRNDVFQEDLMYAEEWELYSRILSLGFNGISINKVLFFGRKHPKSNTGEFWNGNEVRMQSKIEAAKLIITNLEEKKLLSPELIKYFSWESVRLESSELFGHLMAQKTLTQTRKLIEKLRYYSSPVIRVAMQFKKRFRRA